MNIFNWLEWSADRWRYYFGTFLAELKVGNESEARAAELIRCSAIAADKAMEQEKERWGNLYESAK